MHVILLSTPLRQSYKTYKANLPASIYLATFQNFHSWIKTKATSFIIQDGAGKTIAKAKLNAINSSIPEEWRASPPSLRYSNRRMSPVHLYRNTSLTGKLRSLRPMQSILLNEHVLKTGRPKRVTRAFCHRASLGPSTDNVCSMKRSLTRPFRMPKILTITLQSTKHPSALYTGFQSASRISFTSKAWKTSMGYVGWIGTFRSVKKGTGKGEGLRKRDGPRTSCSWCSALLQN